MKPFRLARLALAPAVLYAAFCAVPVMAEDRMAEPASVAELVAAVDIPYETFTLDNGLRVIVHEDRSAPMVAVGVWYDVGAKHEPEGKTGFAHLYEHIMGYGTQNIPEGENVLLDAAGTVGDNASTWFDRTNYYLTVPTGALDLALFAKSDQMGYLLEGVTQETLTNQIGVVQNEKRNTLNQPGGSLYIELQERYFPEGHPFRHSTIGAMDDLDQASLEVVQQWFRDHYGPNNAVLVMVGDIDAATAREKAQYWFGAIPPGPRTPLVRTPVHTLDEPQRFTLQTPVPTPVVVKFWSAPGEADPDSVALDLAAQVLGGLASSRLDNALVRGSEIAVSVSSSNQSFTDISNFTIFATAKPGVEIAEVEAAVEAELARFLDEGPTQDELQRAKTVALGWNIRALDSLSGGGGRAAVLAEGELYHDDPEFYRKRLRTYIATDADAVRDAARAWLARPAMTAILQPGQPQFEEDPGANAGGTAPQYLIARDQFDGVFAETPAPVANSAAPAEADRTAPPAIGDVEQLDFPEIARATLSNGMRVLLIESDDVPTVSLQIAFDAGFAADPRDALGTQNLLIGLMDEGTDQRDALAFKIAQERLGAAIGGDVQWDETVFSLAALSPNLAPSLDLLAEYIRQPGMRAGDLERVRAQQITAIRQELDEPTELVKRVLYPTLYGPDHPYGIPPSGLGEEAAVARIGVDDLRAFHGKWLRPDLATVYIVGDTTLAEATRLLEASFGDWQAPGEPAPAKTLDAPVPDPRPRIILIDKPGAPQAVIRGARVLDAAGTDDLIALRLANEAFGQGSLSRMFEEIRQARGWSYSPYAIVTFTQGNPLFVMHAPVQTDKTGETIALMRELIGGFTGEHPVTAAETARLTEANQRSLPALLTSNGDLLAALVQIDRFDRPDSYYEDLLERYAGFDRSALAEAAIAEMRGNELVFVVIGDRSEIEPQLAEIGLPIEVLAREPGT